MATNTCYVKLRRGIYQKVPTFDDLIYEQLAVNLGTYRNTGWIPHQLPLLQQVTVGATDILVRSAVTPATGTAAVPDEQAHTAPRVLSFNETILRFKLGGRVVAEYLWRDLVSWSTNPPQLAT